MYEGVEEGIYSNRNLNPRITPKENPTAPQLSYYCTNGRKERKAMSRETKQNKGRKEGVGNKYFMTSTWSLFRLANQIKERECVHRIWSDSALTLLSSTCPYIDNGHSYSYTLHYVPTWYKVQGCLSITQNTILHGSTPCYSVGKKEIEKGRKMTRVNTHPFQ